jgi:thiosulfate/3-mercaptopyruvate sulfurtransferase
MADAPQANASIRPAPLVSTEELAAHLDDPHWVILDCRHQLQDHAYGRTAYAAGHIPNARLIDVETELSGPKTGRNGRHPLPDAQEFARTLGRLGVSNAQRVIIYDDNNMFAPRLWWMLRWLGHDHTAVLDGGLKKWQREGRPLTQAQPSITPTHFTARTNDALRVSADTVEAHLQQPDMLVIDARAHNRYQGQDETLDKVGGHIPGARNRVFTDNFDTAGCFKPASQLREEFSQLLAGQVPSQVVHQCGSGVTACVNLLAMELAGLGGARLYPGSWSEWCADEQRPVRTGPNP